MKFAPNATLATNSDATLSHHQLLRQPRYEGDLHHHQKISKKTQISFAGIVTFSFSFAQCSRTRTFSYSYSHPSGPLLLSCFYCQHLSAILLSDTFLSLYCVGRESSSIELLHLNIEMLYDLRENIYTSHYVALLPEHRWIRRVLAWHPRHGTHRRTFMTSETPTQYFAWWQHLGHWIPTIFQNYFFSFIFR